MKALTAIVVLLVLGALWYAWSRDPFLDHEVASAERASPTPVDRPLVSSGDDGGTQREVVPTGGEGPRARASVSGLSWLIRGRCVNAKREPLAGVVAELAGRPYGSSGEVWSEVTPQTTADDGRFEFRIAPPKNFRVHLSLQAEALVSVSCGWRPSGERSVVDLGDILMKPGGAIRGVVTDSRGVPQQGVRMYFGEWVEHDGSIPFDVARHYATSDARGEYQVPPLAAGKVALRILNAILRSPTEIEIPAGVPECLVPVIVESAEDWPSIRGVVVDDAGHTISGVRVGLPNDAFGRDNRPTLEDGRFTIMRPRGAQPPILDGPVRLHTDVLGFESFSSKKEFAWGSRNVRVALTRLAGLDLRVTDGSSAIEEYSIYIAKAPQSGIRIHLRYPIVGNPGPHERGIAHIAGPQRGDYWLKVLPEDPRWSESLFHPVRFESGPDTRLDVVLTTPTVQRVLVRFAATEVAVAGAKIELLEPMDERPIEVGSKAFRRVPEVSGTQPYGWQSGVTDARGEFDLRGPRDVELTLRVSGPGFSTVLRPNVSLVHDGDPIVVEVDAGATVTGTVRPARFLRQLEEMAKGSLQWRPGIVLKRGRETIPLNSRKSARIATDGSFQIDDVPAGNWDLKLVYVKVRPGVTSMKTLSIRSIRNLKNDETRHVDIDLSEHLFATIQGTIFVDATPVPRGSLRLQKGNRSLTIFADDEGHYRALVPPGRYATEIGAHRMGIPARIRGDETVELMPGQSTTQAVHGYTRRVTLRTVDATGKVVPGVVIGVGHKPRRARSDLKPTDAEGRRNARLPLGELLFWVSPKGNRRGTSAQRVHEINLLRGDVPLVIRVEIPETLGY